MFKKKIRQLANVKVKNEKLKWSWRCLAKYQADIAEKKPVLSKNALSILKEYREVYNLQPVLSVSTFLFFVIRFLQAK